MTRYVVVAGADTGVGKTVTVAALAVLQARAGRSVSVVKPVQTGLLPDGAGDVDAVRSLAGVPRAYELVRLPDPLAPESAARRTGVDIPTVADLAERVGALPGNDVVLVEGTGGVAVRLDGDGRTLLDLGRALQWHGDVEVVVVVRAGLGTLNHTSLTVDAVRTADLDVAGLVVGSWPDDPDLAARSNREDLPRITGLPLLAVLPAGAGALDPRDFQQRAPTWFSG